MQQSRFRAFADKFLSVEGDSNDRNAGKTAAIICWIHTEPIIFHNLNARNHKLPAQSGEKWVYSAKSSDFLERFQNFFPPSNATITHDYGFDLHGAGLSWDSLFSTTVYNFITAPDAARRATAKNEQQYASNPLSPSLFQHGMKRRISGTVWQDCWHRATKHGNLS